MKQNYDTEPWEAAILRLKEKAHMMGLSHEDIASRSGLMPSTVRRVMNLKYCPSLKVFLQMAEIVGFEITEK